MPKTSRLNMESPTSSALRRASRPHAHAVRERGRARQDDAVLLREPGQDLDLGQAEEADRDVAPARAAVLEHVDEAAVTLAEDAGAGDDEGPRLLPRHDLDVHRGVGREL